MTLRQAIAKYQDVNTSVYDGLRFTNNPASSLRPVSGCHLTYRF